MKTRNISILAGFACGMVFPFYANANVQAQAQAQAGAQQSAQVQADKKSVNASGKTSADASAQAGKTNAQLESGSTFEAALTKPLDCKKNKKGDPVEARANKDVKSNGEVVIPKGSKLLGHVTEAKARGKGESESQLGIVFDKAVTKDGREIPLNVAIQAVAASEAAVVMAQQGAAEPMMAQGGAAQRSGASAGSAGGGLVGGVTSTAGAAVGDVAGATGTVGSTANAALGGTGSAAGNAAGLTGALSSNSSGVLGLQGINMVSETASGVTATTSGPSQSCLLSSTTQNVRLESGTRFLLRVANP